MGPAIVCNLHNIYHIMQTGAWSHFTPVNNSQQLISAFIEVYQSPTHLYFCKVYYIGNLIRINLYLITSLMFNEFKFVFKKITQSYPYCMYI